MGQAWALFGAALDPSESIYSVNLKRAYLNSLSEGTLPSPNFLDPYDALIHRIKHIGQVEDLGKVPIESWLTPKPHLSDLDLVNMEAYSTFIDVDGCRDYANIVQRFVRKRVGDDRPLMIGVDHSLTGGVLAELVEKHGRENVSMLVFDAHLDAISISLKQRVGTHLAEGETSYPKFRDRPDSYNAGSFIKHLINNDVIEPKNVTIWGVADHPRDELEKTQDEYVREYAEAYVDIERQGVTMIRQKDIILGGIEPSLTNLKHMPQKVYISLDVDVSSYASVHAARFMNIQGIDGREIVKAASYLNELARKGILSLAGLDVTEIDIHLAGLKSEKISDKTLEFATDFVNTILSVCA